MNIVRLVRVILCASLILPAGAGVAHAQTPGPVFVTTMTEASTGEFFVDLGANVSRMNDRVFIGQATQNTGTSAASGVMDWTGIEFGDAWGYLEQNGMLVADAQGGQLAGVFATRASDGPGGNGAQASIGVSSLVLNDNAIGSGASTWSFYGTTLRTAPATGQSTLGMELDVENQGAAAPIYPSSLFAHGETANLWIAAGGELANQASAGYTFNNTSAAMVILPNNGGGYANVAYDKGIVFGATALNSNETAIAFATGHEMEWFNASNQVTGAITSQATTPAQGQQIVMGAFGTVIEDMSGVPQLSVANDIAGATSFLTVTASTDNTPVISANGSAPSVNIALSPKGSGTLAVGSSLGVSCSGAPSSAYRTVDGLVTHC